MSTTIKVEFNDEQSKTIVSSTKVESDEMNAEEVLKLAKQIAIAAQEEARTMSLVKLR